MTIVKYRLKTGGQIDLRIKILINIINELDYSSYKMHAGKIHINLYLDFSKAF